MKKILLGLTGLILMFSCKNSEEKQTDETDSKEVNVYTHRHYESDRQLFKQFEEETGIRVNVINASADELIQKMSMEGKQSPADVLITVDAGRLERAKSRDLLQPIESEVLENTIASHLKDAENHWFSLTKRARVIAYAKDRVNPEELSTYEDLASEKWKGKLLIRSSGNIYNQSLMASMIVNNGEEEAKKWAEAVVKNMARSPKGNDRDQVKAVVAGEGDLAIVNTYYIGKMLNSDDPEEVKAGEKVGLFFPNQEGRGTHINVSGAGVAKYAPNKANAIKFIEFLVSEEAQKIFAHSNYEYPVNDAVEPAPLLQEWGEFKEDTLNLSQLGQNNKKAVMLFDEAGWK
ncbi:MAG: Fe(3+) ABC transporter substrate-binding protein [Salegentibacter sp.]|uniref:Iron(III) transport system substrate-binding protein n=1 Tax=Salegentibacter flavus TaxID=287099 RepID=A0A1I5C778_9FLAO|nr:MULTISPECIES: Fe(3+) ABC transporter substrate-binding protein [Salegentibacter]MDR9457367.1 Fe(3+) ABC transporter substrate-binding protein [Salegentibacter sp.]SFN82682.1 iron(III) transport system substrate-binding protein [Salegentibacter flavus]